jgi:ethanolamine utilization protein EutM
MEKQHLQKTALGMVETVGLVASIEAADAMAKVANVSITCREEIGGGYVTIMVRGEVGAVQASVDAGVAAAKKGGQLIAGHVIARPHRFTEAIIPNGDCKVVRALAD